MDKKVIFAVAGSGKTTHLVESLNENSRSLILTYTNNNLVNIQKKIIAKFGIMPQGIQVMSFFSFLYSFCFRPFALDTYKTTGILFQPNANRFERKSNIEYFLTNSRRLYSNRISLLITEKNLTPLVAARIEKYFDCLIIDEIQDIGANDFNLLMELSATQVNMLFVGDFYQHTYDTSRDGNVRNRLHDNFDSYVEQFTNAGIVADQVTLISSHRCSPTVCQFVNDNLGIEIASRKVSATEIRELATTEIVTTMNNDNIIKLFYQKSSDYMVEGRNWGESKGEDSYEDVCVVLNATGYNHFSRGTLSTLPPQTKNKLYVAITRAHRNVYFVQQSLLGDYIKS